jgi:hypothetical protein
MPPSAAKPRPSLGAESLPPVVIPVSDARKLYRDNRSSLISLLMAIPHPLEVERDETHDSRHRFMSGWLFDTSILSALSPGRPALNPLEIT